MNEILKVENLSFSYENDNLVLKNINFSLYENETIVVMGPNGSGKSTLLWILVNILKNFKGKITLFNKSIESYNESELYSKINLVFQNPDNQLFCDKVKEEILFILENANIPLELATKRLNYYSKALGLNDLLELEPQHLSFGQKKRLALASVIVMEPEILLLDEPSSNLDYKNKCLLIDTLNNYKKAKIIVTQDIHFAFLVSKRLIYIENGNLIYDGNLKIDNLKTCNDLYDEITKLKQIFN